MARILFYLPNVTLWWFDNVVTPLARLLAAEHEVHIMVPPAWRGTGITADRLAPFADGPEIHWHILDGEDHPALRENGAADPEVRARVAAIDADYTLCRCADPEVIHAFPGTVRFLMEGAATPLANGGNPIIFTTRLFEHGAMPPLGEEQGAALDAAFADIWADYEAGLRAPVPSWRAAAGIAAGRKAVAVPLEYELEESFTVPHRLFADNLTLVDRVAAAFDDDVFLAFTNHPINEDHADNRAIEAKIAALGDRGALIRSHVPGIAATDLVARDCDGAVLDLSKCYLVYAYFGVPMARPRGHATARWLNVETDLDAFAAAVRDGRATAPSPEMTRRWFACHIANSALDVANRRLDAGQVLDHIRRPLDPGRWEGNLDLFRRQMRRQARARRRLAA